MKFHKRQPGVNNLYKNEASGRQSSVTFARCLKRAAGVVALCFLAVFFGPRANGAESNKNKVDLLVARNQVQDPFFRHSVVLMLPENETQLIVGLIINKPTRLTLGKLFPDSPEFKNRTDEAYFGGPVDIRTPSIVFHSQTAPDNAVKLYGNVYLTFDSDLISKAYKTQSPGSMPRLFLGRAQWGPGQLDDEIRRGGWYRIQADGDEIFNSDPKNLWPTLHAQSAPSKYIRYRIPPRGLPPHAGKTSVM